MALQHSALSTEPSGGSEDNHLYSVVIDHAQFSSCLLRLTLDFESTPEFKSGPHKQANNSAIQEHTHDQESIPSMHTGREDL
jgi:hypothetical protein